MQISKRVGIVALSALSILAASLPFAVNATAQGGDRFGQNPPPGQFNQPGQAGPNPQGGFRQGMMMGGAGGAAAIDSDNMWLYIVQGNTVFKVSKADLKVVGQSQLMPMGPMGPNPGGGRGGGQPGGGTGGGQRE